MGARQVTVRPYAQVSHQDVADMGLGRYYAPNRGYNSYYPTPGMPISGHGYWHNHRPTGAPLSYYNHVAYDYGWAGYYGHSSYFPNQHNQRIMHQLEWNNTARPMPDYDPMLGYYT